MVRRFKNALCLAHRPDYYGPAGGWHQSCHRRTGHEGRHRIVYWDGGVLEWNDGDRESVPTKEPRKEA